MSTHRSDVQQDRIMPLETIAQGIHKHVQSALHEFQSAVIDDHNERVRVVDTLVVGSFVDPATDSPGDFDILVVTDSAPPEEVQDSFWRYVNEQGLNLADPFCHPESDAKVDCVGVTSVDKIDTTTHGNRSYSLGDATFIETES